MSTTDPAPLTALVADDDPATLRLIARIAANAGYRIVQANDGREALDRILSDCPDLLITDWDMPGLDGIQLCREIRRSDLPFYVYVLLLTAKSRSEEMVQALDAGADDFISKPINPAVLLARLKAGARIVVAERRLRHLGESDSLTGVLNRRAFHERFAAEWDRATRYQHPPSCVMIDLDFFKKLNDTYGHAAGDAVLQAIVSLLESHRRTSDVLARYGGEEFCLLLPETDEAGAAAWAERVRLAIAEARIPFSNKPLSVAASLGVATRLADTPSPEALIALADQALLVAKELGRNRVVPFSTLLDHGSDSPDRHAAYAPLEKVLARDVMAPAVYCPQEQDSVDQVVDLLLNLRLNAAPVVDDQQRLAGIISENDLLAVAASSPCLNTPIREYMKTNVVQYDEGTPAKTVFQFLARASVPRVVVVRDGRPTGVISRATLLRWLRNWSATHRQSEVVAGTNAMPRVGVLKAADAGETRPT
jgi:two-component system, cell cycle response regulator